MYRGAKENKLWTVRKTFTSLTSSFCLAVCFILRAAVCCVVLKRPHVWNDFPDLCLFLLQVDFDRLQRYAWSDIEVARAKCGRSCCAWVTWSGRYQIFRNWSLIFSHENLPFLKLWLRRPHKLWWSMLHVYMYSHIWGAYFCVCMTLRLHSFSVGEFVYSYICEGMCMVLFVSTRTDVSVCVCGRRFSERRYAQCRDRSRGWLVERESLLWLMADSLSTSPGGYLTRHLLVAASFATSNGGRVTCYLRAPPPKLFFPRP